MSKIKNMADAFRIWQYANPRDWDVTAEEVGEHLNISSHRVAKLCQSKGWTLRLRKRTPQSWVDRMDSPTRRPSVRLDEVQQLLGLPAC